MAQVWIEGHRSGVDYLVKTNQVREYSMAWGSGHSLFAGVSQQTGEACLEPREAATSDWAVYVQVGLAYSGAAKRMTQWDE